MKKLFFLPIVALAMASCSDEKGPWGIEQTNPQLPGFDPAQLDVAPSVILAETVDLKTWNDENHLIPVAQVVPALEWPSDYKMSFVMQMSPAADFSRVAEIPTVTKTDSELATLSRIYVGVTTVFVDPDDWQAAYTSTISKGPKAKDVYLRFVPYAVNGNEKVRVGDPDFYVGATTATVLPIPSDFTIEDSYYLLGSINGWDVATAVKFEHSDADVYDDPVFTLTCDVDGTDGWWWKVLPASTYATGGWVDGDNASFGVADNGDSALEGMLVGRTATDDCGAGCLKVSGRMKMTINMEELTYAFESALEQLYTPGDANGWNQIASQILTTSDYANYEGFAVLSPNGFKFSTRSNWDGINYGAGAEAGTLGSNGDAANLTVEKLGLYWCHVNIPELTYTTTEITTIGAIGDFNGWGSSVALTPSDDMLTWSGTIDFGDGNGSFKFRCNDDWEIALGGDAFNLSWAAGGPNIEAPGAGSYDVVLYLDEVPYVTIMTAK